jgi:hypothetical protein
MDVVSLRFRTDLAVLALGGSQVDHRDRHVVVRTPATYWWGNFLLLADPVGPDEIPERHELSEASCPGRSTSPGGSTRWTEPPATRKGSSARGSG